MNSISVIDHLASIGSGSFVQGIDSWNDILRRCFLGDTCRNDFSKVYIEGASWRLRTVGASSLCGTVKVPGPWRWTDVLVPESEGPCP